MAPIDRWSSNITTAGIRTFNSCAPNGAGYLEVAVDPVSHPSHSNGTWKFTAPSGTTVAGFSYLRSAFVQNWSDIAGFRSDQGVYDPANLADWCGPPTSCRSIDWSWTGWLLNAKPGVLLLLEACALENPCDGNSNGWYRIASAQVILEDSSSPTFTTLTGALSNGGVLQGGASLSFQAADTGVGVYKLHATVDGRSLDDRTIDANSGKCVAVMQGTRNFNYAVPCPLSTSATTKLDTTSLADGQHTVDVKVEDASGNMTTVFHDDIVTRNAGPERTTKSKIRLRITPRRTSNMHAIHWRGRVIGGKLPRRGATVLAQVKQGRGWIVFRQIRTNAAGRFRFDYRFHATTVATTYAFRVALAHGSVVGQAKSKTIKVRVEP